MSVKTRNKTDARAVDEHKSAARRSLAILTRISFVLVIALATARATFLETLRDPTPIVPGAMDAPAAPGPTTSLVLNLLCCLPALLILVRRVFEKTCSVRFTWTHALLILLALWAIASTLWSSDKFAAAITSSHLLAAAAMFWAASQLVRSWLRVRIVAAMCFGLLLVY